MNFSFDVTYMKKINPEERGQANKLQAYASGDLKIDGQTIMTYRSLKLYNSKYHNTQLIDIPKLKGTDGVYRDIYNVSPEVKKVISNAIITAYKSTQLSNE